MGTIALGLAVVVLIYVVVELCGLIYAEKNPPEPYPDEDPVTGKIVTITHEFTCPGSPLPRVGKVEIKGSNWTAETTDDTALFRIGDTCRVIGRDGLTVIVEALSDSE